MRIIFLFLVVTFHSAAFSSDIKIYSSANGDKTEKLAATQLSLYLSKIYINDKFSVTNTDTADCSFILSIRSIEENGYSIQSNGGKIIIRASNKFHLIGAVFDFLEHEGCYFQLSDEYVPVLKEPFKVLNISIRNNALVNKRIIFNWFNFLSGCSSWDLKDWQFYIRQAVKLHFNSLMVHTYGNNPMIEFTFNGKIKPVGYLSSTDQGRDWGTQHINDVRNMPGAEEVFFSPVFSSEAAKVSWKYRHTALKKMMQAVFEYAHLWGMKVLFAYDMDSESANPQNIIRTLPVSSCIFVGKGAYALANPDTPEGYAYYKSQLKQILEDYPQIDEYVLWGRGEASINWSLWGAIKKEEMPHSWQKEYENHLQRTTDIKDSSYNYAIFAWAKIANTYKRILKDLKKDTKTELSVGSWRFNFVPVLNKFTEADISFIALDYEIKFDYNEIQQIIKNVASQRKITPVFWAHHDDLAYIGRPYRPFQNLATVFQNLSIHDFGIIHWTTRPLDFYFKNTMRQLWSNTKNQQLKNTIEQYCNTVFKAQANIFNKYITSWINSAPMFGRETTDYFNTTNLTPNAEIIKQSQIRNSLLKEVDVKSLSSYATNTVFYYKNYEKFIQQFFLANSRKDSSIKLWHNMEINKAKTVMSENIAKKAIESFSRASKYGGPNKGEKGLLISLNSRWYPYIIAQQQLVGASPISYLFNQTVHESLAKGAGSFTFYFDDKSTLSKTLGEKETGLKYHEGNGKNGLVIDSAFSFIMKTFSDSIPRHISGNIEVLLSNYPLLRSKSYSNSIIIEISEGMKTLSSRRLFLDMQHQFKKVTLPIHFKDAIIDKPIIKIKTSKQKILLKAISFVPE